MKTFECGCGNRLFFENSMCLKCMKPVGFLPDVREMSGLEPVDGRWRALHPAAVGASYRKCSNYESYDTCNWMVPSDEGQALCHACRLNRMVPNLADLRLRQYWANIEGAKRRLVYTLDYLGLPVKTKAEAGDLGLAFDFLADPPPTEGPGSSPKVMTGHASGLITLNVAEADDVVREQTRTRLKEPYRTLLGHFRHEIGHYYWEWLARDERWLEAYRGRFGDERQDYAEALKAHYGTQSTDAWKGEFITSYAASHPWEDWAETFAHYLHMVDTSETAKAFSLTVEGKRALEAEEHGFDAFEARWTEFTLVINDLNRSMGLPDAYPFAHTPPVVAKLRFVYDACMRLKEENVSRTGSEAGSESQLHTSNSAAA